MTSRIMNLNLHYLYYIEQYYFSTQCILVSSIVQYTPVRYGKYKYPAWAEGVGWGVSLVSIIWIPLGAIHEIYINKGSLSEVSTKNEQYFSLVLMVFQAALLQQIHFVLFNRDSDQL